MSVTNKIIKFFGYIGIQLLLVVSMYLTSLVFTAPVLCVVEAIYNAVAVSIPVWFADKFYITYLVSSIPLTLVFVTLVNLNIVKRNK